MLGAKWLFQEFLKAQEYIDLGKVFHFVRVFEVCPEVSYIWKEGKESPTQETIRIQDSDSALDDDKSPCLDLTPCQSKKDKKKMDENCPKVQGLQEN
jgi:hypothetical protein